jgi:phage shock protein A
MTFFDKLIHSAKGAINDTLERNQDLGANARQNIRDLDEQLRDADAALVDVRAENELLKGKKEKAEAEIAKWLKAATNAAGKDDGLARECLAKKAAAKAQLDTIEATIANFGPTVAALEQHIEQMRSQRDNLGNQSDLIGVRSEVADVQMKAAEILGGTGSVTSLAAQEDALAKKEAKAKAATSIVNDRSGNTLEARVAALNAGPSIEDELAALKAGK